MQEENIGLYKMDPFWAVVWQRGPFPTPGQCPQAPQALPSSRVVGAMPAQALANEPGGNRVSGWGIYGPIYNDNLKNGRCQ